jgi:hypothetical protein
MTIDRYTGADDVGLEEELRRSEKRAAAIRLRNAGASLAKIALTLGYADSKAAGSDIDVGLRELILVPAGEMVGRQQQLIMDMTRACYTNAVSGDTDAVNAIRQLMDHQAKLFGLYAPSRHRVVTEEVNFAEEAASLMKDLGVDVAIDVPPTIDASDPWAS